jgi:molybdopterin/thiamine biosynthesis adenylyltransferase
MYIDAIELFPLKGRMPTLEEIQDKFMVDDGYKYLRDCLGPEVVDSIQKCKLFMIGAGAIGCELLKNYAMLGLGVLHEG